MKKGLIVFLVFAVVLVIGLMITGVFGKAEANTATLKVNATNTTIVVRDDQDQVISNDNGVLIIGDTYTVTVTPYDDCILQYFTINDINYFKKLENNQCSFVCNGNVSIKTISVVDPTLEEPPVAGVTTVYSATFSSCQVAGPSIGSVKNVDTITLILYDSTNSVVARLGVGETFDLLIEKETYRVEYSSSVVYKNVKITNTSIDLKYHNLPYTFTAKSDANLKITSFNTAAMAVIPGWVFLVGEQEKDTEFVAGETYTLSDNAPEGLKTNLYVNNQLVQLPYTFTYSEDMTFDFELVEAPVVETATISVTSNVEGYAIHYAFVDNLYERTLVDETTELIVGGDYVFYVTPPSGYYLTVWGGTFGLTSEDYIPSTSGRGGVIEEPGAIEFDLTFKPAVTPTINGENFTTTFTNAYGEETNILVLGQRYTATFTPNEGYQMYRITNENGSSIDFSQPYTFTAAEGMLFDVNCFEICEPTIDFDIPNASYVVRDAATHVAVSSPYVVGAEYEIYIFSMCF